MTTIRALRRGLAVVDCLAGREEPWSLAELHRASGIDKSTLLRLLATPPQAYDLALIYLRVIFFAMPAFI